MNSTGKKNRNYDYKLHPMSCTAVTFILHKILAVIGFINIEKKEKKDDKQEDRCQVPHIDSGVD